MPWRGVTVSGPGLSVRRIRALIGRAAQLAAVSGAAC